MTTEEIKQQYDMQKILDMYNIKKDRKGFICCIFHNEKTASMKVYKDSVYCFGCGRSADIFSFVMGMEHCDFKTAYVALGGSYKAKSDHQRNLYHYHLQKRKESELKRRKREEQERIDIINEIHLQKLFRQLSPVFSDDWCDAVNRLEYLFNKLDYLTEKR
jgi:DNA primase